MKDVGKTESEMMQAIDRCLNRNYVTANVLPRLSSRKMSAEMQKQGLVWKAYLDLIISYYIPIEGIVVDDRGMSIHITDSFLSLIGMSQNEISACASRNLEQTSKIKSLPAMLAEDFGAFCGEDDPSMIVITNQDLCYGAACMTSEKILTQIEQYLGTEYLIIPSSVHEVIAIPVIDDLKGVTEMIREINTNLVEDEEQLADHLYRCVSGQVSIV